MLDYKENDIYLHIDKKVRSFDMDSLKKYISESKLVVLDNRVDVQWGNFSQIECELRLLEQALDGKYEYYHLMSGVDLPLKSQAEIHRFFDQRKGTEFVHFQSMEIDRDAYNRVSKYHFFAKRKKKLIEKILDKLCLICQVGVDRTKKTNMVYQKGANWFSITHELATYIVENRHKIEKMFMYTLCADEMFLQTLIANSRFKNSVSEPNYCDNYGSICYLIDWERGNPYVFRKQDFEMLISSGQLFARKFSWNTDKDIIDRLVRYVKQ